MGPQICGRVNALNGLFSFLQRHRSKDRKARYECQRPERAFFISTTMIISSEENAKMFCVNALNGLFSFLRYPLRTRINTGFAGSFLQVFV